MKKTIIDLYYEFLALGHEKQKKLAEVINEENTFVVDYKNCNIQFDSDLTLPFTILGSHSFEEDSWLWAWENKNLKLTSEQYEKSLWFKKYGEKEEISEFISPMLQLKESLSATDLALISSGLSSYDCYFRHKQEYGAYYILIENFEALNNATDENLFFYNSCITDCWNSYDDGAHRDIVEFYLKHKKVHYTFENNILHAKKDNQEMILTFNDRGYGIKGEVVL